MLFRFEDVHKFYGAYEVLRGVTFQVNPAERVGLVGRNGAGKTTLFRLLTGIEEADRGQIFTLKNLRLGVLQQQPIFNGDLNVREETLSVFTHFREIEAEMTRLEHSMSEVAGAELDEVMHTYSDLQHRYEIAGGFSYQARAEAALIGLGFKKGEFHQPACQLSGGQKARLALAKLLLAEPDVLLLDEPTNHLDVNSVEWLEEFLAEYMSAYVIISHDRFLLDRVTRKTIEIESGRATSYAGNYTAYVRQREERRALQMREYEQQQELIARTEEFIRRNLAGQKTKQAKSRRNMLERLEKVEAVRQQRTGDFRLQPVARTGDNVLVVDELTVGYGTTSLAGNISFLLRRGERLGIIGPNGSGKTTFLKTINGDVEPLQGGLTWGANIVIAYFDQELADLDLQSTVMQEMIAMAPRATEGELRSYLAKFLFTGDDLFKSVAALSGGERSRLAIAKIVYSRANVLLLDEPTNHLDIASREALESALSDYAGTIITVSHDRYFLDKIATEILHFDNSTATYFTGSYSDFYEYRHRKPNDDVRVMEVARMANRRKQSQPTTPKKPKRRLADEIEKEIAGLEQEMTELTDQLSSPPPNWQAEQYSEAAVRQSVIATQLEALYREWEAAHSEATSQ